MELDFQRLLVDESSDALIAVALDGRVLWWNRGAERTYGFTSEEAVGRTIAELVVPRDRIDAEDAFRRETIERGEATCEAVRRRKDGSLACVNISARAVRDADGTCRCLISTARDVTQLKIQRDAKLVEARYGELLESTPMRS